MSNVDLNKYKDFVEAVTSADSNNTKSFTDRLTSLDAETGVNMSLLLTGAIGMSSEGGEFAEIVKKCVFQGKELTADNIDHLKSELGDIAWYWINSCRAIGVDPNDVIAGNVNKLKKRYTGGEFDVYASENRAEGDR